MKPGISSALTRSRKYLHIRVTNKKGVVGWSEALGHGFHVRHRSGCGSQSDPTKSGTNNGSVMGPTHQSNTSNRLITKANAN